MTDLSKPVKRRTLGTVRDGSKPRQLVVTLYPGDVLGLRPAKTRREEIISLEFCYFAAVKARVLRERAEKRKAKGKS